MDSVYLHPGTNTNTNSSPNEEYQIDVPYIYNGSESCPIFTKQHTLQRVSEKSIKADLKKIGLSSDIISSANNIYKNMSIGTKRGKRRRMLIFFCVFNAYVENNITVDPISLAKKCGLDKSGISKALSMCSPVNSVSESPLVNHTANNYIKVFYDKLNQNWIDFPADSLDHINDMTDYILESDPELMDEKPQTVAAAVLVFYMQLNGYCLNKEKYKGIFGISDMTINKLKKRINRAYNN